MNSSRAVLNGRVLTCAGGCLIQALQSDRPPTTMPTAPCSLVSCLLLLLLRLLRPAAAAWMLLPWMILDQRAPVGRRTGLAPLDHTGSCSCCCRLVAAILDT